MIFQHKLIQSLERHGNNVAIEHGKRAVTYRKLLDAANKVTAFLLEHLSKETLVVFCSKAKSTLSVRSLAQLMQGAFLFRSMVHYQIVE